MDLGQDQQRHPTVHSGGVSRVPFPSPSAHLPLPFRLETWNLEIWKLGNWETWKIRNSAVFNRFQLFSAVFSSFQPFSGIFNRFQRFLNVFIRFKAVFNRLASVLLSAHAESFSVSQADSVIRVAVSPVCGILNIIKGEQSPKLSYITKWVSLWER